MNFDLLPQGMSAIKMVDLQAQIAPIRKEVDAAIAEVIDETSFIRGERVERFERQLAAYLGAKHIVSCGNGTDALQISLMALGLSKGDEVIVPAFAYAAVIEVVLLLGLVPVVVDVDPETFNLDTTKITAAISSRTKVIMPVHLYGQMADMDTIMQIADDHQLMVIEDNAQSLGVHSTSGRCGGTLGHVGCTSFFPSKNLGCFGDGGAIITDDAELAQKMKMITTHGQHKKYHHQILGVNSRLDAIQAAVLGVKLPHLDGYIECRRWAADIYESELNNIKKIVRPVKSHHSEHVYHQYTIKVLDGKRDQLKDYLAARGVRSIITSDAY